MDTYDFIRQAVIDRCSLTANYDGKTRSFSPHAIGRDNEGGVNVMTFQYGGYSSQGLPPGGDWRCFEVRRLQNVIRNSDQWHTSNDHSRRNTCVTKVDVEAR